MILITVFPVPQTKRMLSAVLDVTSDTTGVPDEWVFATDAQKEKCLTEMYDATNDPDSAKRTLIVNKRIMKEPAPDLGGPIDWDAELKPFGPLD